MEKRLVANRIAKGYIKRIYHGDTIRDSFERLRQDSSAFFRCLVSLGFIEDSEINSNIDRWDDTEYEGALAERGRLRLNTKAYSDGNVIFGFDGSYIFYIEEGGVRLRSLPSKGTDILKKDWEILFPDFN